MLRWLQLAYLCKLCEVRFVNRHDLKDSTSKNSCQAWCQGVQLGWRHLNSWLPSSIDAFPGFWVKGDGLVSITKEEEVRHEFPYKINLSRGRGGICPCSGCSRRSAMLKNGDFIQRLSLSILVFTLFFKNFVFLGVSRGESLSLYRVWCCLVAFFTYKHTHTRV